MIIMKDGHQLEAEGLWLNTGKPNVLAFCPETTSAQQLRTMLIPNIVNAVTGYFDNSYICFET